MAQLKAEHQKQLEMKEEEVGARYLDLDIYLYIKI